WNEAEDDFEDDFADDFGEPWSGRGTSFDRLYAEDRTRRPSPTGRKRRGSSATWKQALDRLRQGTDPFAKPAAPWPADRQIVYFVDVPTSLQTGALVVEIGYQTRKKDGGWTKPKSQRIPKEQIPHLPDPEDRELLALLIGAREQNAYTYGN